MLRVFFTIVLPLILPTVIYLLWIWLEHWLPWRSPARGQIGDGVHWASLPWVWLAATGAGLLLLMLFVVTVHFGTAEPGTYVPPRWENGRIVPGHIEPEHNR